MVTRPSSTRHSNAKLRSRRNYWRRGVSLEINIFLLPNTVVINEEEDDGKSEVGGLAEPPSKDGGKPDPAPPENAGVHSEDRDLLENKKDNISVVFIGHVDAGKSTLGGQIL